MKRRLANLRIELVSPKDLNIKLNIIENGNTTVENTLKKISAYYEVTGIPTIAGDSGLYIENIPEEKQPGLFVRRVNGKELTDNEVIDYYTKLVDSIGGKTIAYYITGLALVDEGVKNLGQKFDIECLQFISENILNKRNQFI